MDIEPPSIFDFTSQPPTYSEALHSPSFILEPINSTPPPSYGEVGKSEMVCLWFSFKLFGHLARTSQSCMQK